MHAGRLDRRIRGLTQERELRRLDGTRPARASVRVIALSVLEKFRPMIETRPLEQVPDAYARMVEGKARFRMVLTTSA